MQSFLGCLKYYRRFIEDFAIFASALYELREVDVHAWRCKLKDGHQSAITVDDEEKWSRFQVDFAMLKTKMATAPILRISIHRKRR
uniref:Reverse transcriptase n=1 Tax=Peronospora matthiolae TaxID=2874970 RepID=A0AAV1UW53_9STRA